MNLFVIAIHYYHIIFSGLALQMLNNYSIFKNPLEQEEK
jgi:hypothetical protein